MLLSLHRAGAYPAMTFPSAPKEYTGLEVTKHGFDNVTGKTEVPILTSVPPLVLLIYGQSNAVTISPTADTITVAGVENFNFYNGKTYLAADSILGTERAGGLVSGADGGSWSFALGKKLKAAGHSRVIIVNCAIGATGIEQWQDGGGGFVDGRLRWVLRACQQAGLRPNVVLQMLGESNAFAGHTANNYTTTNRAVIADLRRFGCSAPVFVSQTSLIEGATAPNMAAIRLGQQNTWSDALGIFAGPDTDTLSGLTYRQSDLTHLNDAGVSACADLWLATLQAWFAAHS